MSIIKALPTRQYILKNIAKIEYFVKTLITTINRKYITIFYAIC